MRLPTLWIGLSFVTACRSEASLHGLGPPGDDEPTVPLPPTDTTLPLDDTTPPVVDEESLIACGDGAFAAVTGATGHAEIALAVSGSSPGDEIVVCPGVHSEPSLLVPHSLTLRAADPTVGATRLTFGVVLTGPGDLVISGFTFDLTHAFDTGFTSTPFEGEASVIVENTLFELGDDHSGSFGMDLYLVDAVVRNSRFRGGMLAIRPYNPDGQRFDLEIVDTVIEGAHGGIQIDGPGELRLTDVTFDANHGCGALVVTVGMMDHLGTEPVDIIAEDTRFVSNYTATAIGYAYPAAVGFRTEDSFTCSGCSWADNLPHDLVRDDEVFDAPGSEIAL